MKGGFPDECFISVPINRRPTSGKKTGKQQGCCWGPQNKPEIPPLLPKEHSLQTCSYPSHFLNSRGVFLHWLICCWLLECRVISSVTCGDSGARPWWVHRKQFDLLMRPLPSLSQLNCDGLLQELFRQISYLCRVEKKEVKNITTITTKSPNSCCPGSTMQSCELRT